MSDLAEICIKRRQAVLKKLNSDGPSSEGVIGKEDPEWAEILCIDIMNEEDVENKKKISLDHVEDLHVREYVRKLIDDYCPKKIKDSGVTMRLILRDEEPVHQNPRLLSAQQRDVVSKIVDNWMKESIVRPSNFEFASPIVLVQKRDKIPRLCVDYRQLNRKVVRDRYPLSLIEDQLDKLAEATIYCTLDLKDGFFHVALDEDSVRYTSFIIPDGQFEFLRVPFGLSNSSAVFQRHIKVIFYELAVKNVVLIYLDDLIISAKNEAECLDKLMQVLRVTADYGLKINWKKSNFLVRQVEYLGHLIEAGTVRPSERKILAVKHFPKLMSTKLVYRFLGLSGYFRKFIPQYASIARPLSQLMKGGMKFVFGPEREYVFERLKAALTSKPVLKLYRPGACTELHTYASKYGLGAVLFQRDDEDGQFHPIFYASWKTTTIEQKYSSYELEILAVIKAL